MTLARMKPLSSFPRAAARAVRAVLTDIDDTLTSDGRLPALAYEAMERLRAAGLIVVPVTGRPSGWCDLIARQWPVDAVVGENGAFWFRYDDAARRMIRTYFRTEAQRHDDRRRLDAIAEEVLTRVPGASLAADQQYRAADLAIDFREDVPPLGTADVQRIVDIFERHGATAKVSSIHVNGWYGDHDKLSCSLALLGEMFGIDGRRRPEQIVFVGDSPNDAPMFGYFPNAVGVANVRQFEGRIDALPAYVAEASFGAGFAEVAAALLSARA